MTMTKILKWRLSERPTPENLLKLVESGIMTKEEAKSIVLDEGEINSSDIDSIKNELELLRKMVLSISEKTENRTEIIKIIEKEIPIYRDRYPYVPQWPWWKDNVIWCASNGSVTATNYLNQMSGTSGLVNN